ncbi:MAG: bifunctional DNA primase/polymerase, partial [Candidatus Nitrosocosmicus sp.]|nr:bifunctional DNA primase/polymerase [Candidatus Nitrosocosmicus sp.]
MQVPENHANFLGDPNTIEAALSYNSKGWNVIPIPKPGEIIRKTWDANLQKSVDIKADGKSAEGYGFWDPWKQNKQTKEDVIRLFKDRDNCNLALVTGKVSSIIAFDIDGKDAKDHFFSTIEKLNDPAIKDAIKNTMQTKTGSGNGIHIIIKYNTK